MRIWAGFLVAALAGLSGAAVSPAQESERIPSITVMGSATVSAKPDTAEVNAGVVTQAPTAGQALAQNSATMSQVLKVVTSLGIAERDIQTTSINVQPQRSQPRPGTQQPAAIVGYEVSNQVHVKVRDLAVLGRLLDALVSQGGANALGGISFSIADPAPLLQQGRARAIADAQQKAQAYAAAAGVKVGRVVFIRDATSGPPRPMAQRLMAASAVPVATGEQELEVSVSVTYAIE